MQSVLKVFTQFMSTEIELERIIYQKEFDGKFVGCQIMDGYNIQYSYQEML